MPERLVRRQCCERVPSVRLVPLTLCPLSFPPDVRWLPSVSFSATLPRAVALPPEPERRQFRCSCRGCRYIGAAMGFSKQRCGFLYGTCSEEGVVQARPARRRQPRSSSGPSEHQPSHLSLLPRPAAWPSARVVRCGAALLPLALTELCSPHAIHKPYPKRQVHVIYEPPQEGTVDHVVIIRNEDEENRVAFIMEQLGRATSPHSRPAEDIAQPRIPSLAPSPPAGIAEKNRSPLCRQRPAGPRRLKRVGWIFSVSVQHERHFPLSEKEVRAMAALQAEAPDDFFVTARALSLRRLPPSHPSAQSHPRGPGIPLRYPHPHPHPHLVFLPPLTSASRWRLSCEHRRSWRRCRTRKGTPRSISRPSSARSRRVGGPWAAHTSSVLLCVPPCSRPRPL